MQANVYSILILIKNIMNKSVKGKHKTKTLNEANFKRKIKISHSSFKVYNIKVILNIFVSKILELQENNVSCVSS